MFHWDFIVSFIVLYLAASYSIQRICEKFNIIRPKYEYYIPAWNCVLLGRCAEVNMIYVVCAVAGLPFLILVMFYCAFISSYRAEFNTLLHALILVMVVLLSITFAVLSARMFALIAEKLGKKFWPFAVIFFIGEFFGVVPVMLLMLLAFDKSKPVKL